MNIEKALENIKFLKNNRFMLDEIKCIRENKDEAIPVLLDYLKYAGEQEEELEADYMAHIYALFLLAEFGIHDMFEPAVKYLELPDDETEAVLGDSRHDSIYRSLATVALADDVGRIKSIADNISLCWCNRTSALNTLLTMYAEGKYSFNELEDFCVSLSQNLLNNKDKDDEFAGFLALSCLDIYAEKAFPLIERLYDANRIDIQIMGDKDDFIKEIKSTNRDSALKKLKEDTVYMPITDTVKEMEWWACFKEETKKSIPKPVSYTELANGTKQAKSNKIGRNEPCPCGSGKKYKKCCGR